MASPIYSICRYYMSRPVGDFEAMKRKAFDQLVGSEATFHVHESDENGLELYWNRQIISLALSADRLKIVIMYPTGEKKLIRQICGALDNV